MNKHDEIKKLISAYVDGETTEEESRAARKYIEEQPEYKRYYQDLQKVSSSLNTWLEEDLSPDLEQKIVNDLLDKQKREGIKMETRKSNLMPALGGVCATLLVVLVAFQIHTTRGIQGRLRMAADDIGDQFSQGNVPIQKQNQRMLMARVRDASEYMASETEKLGTTTQYEPYYLSRDYKADEASVGKDAAKAERKELARLPRDNEVQSRLGDKAVMAKRIPQKVMPAQREFLHQKAPEVKASSAGPVVSGPQTVTATEADSNLMLDHGKMVRKRKITGAGTQAFGLGGSITPQEPARGTDALVLKEGQASNRILVARGSKVNGRTQEVKPYINIFRSGEHVDSIAGGRHDGYDDLDYQYDPREKRLYDRQDGYYEEIPQGREEYDYTYESPFLEVYNNPLSTFSIDVDTASYSNVRRFLTNGQMPPRNAVRIEEMINYFNYDYPQPKWGDPFSITVEGTVCPWNSQHRLVLIGLQGKQLQQREMPPSHLVFLIDVSGSMKQANKLPLLKDSFRNLVNHLRPEDRVSIVTYNGRAGVILEAVAGSDKYKLLNAINRLHAGGSTAGERGIRLAYKIAARHFIRGGNNRVILATDGDFNVGVSNDNELVQLIEDRRRSNVFLSILGFGTGNYKDSKMEKIANKGNGNYAYIDSIQEADKVLVKELGSMLFTIAKDVKLQVEFNPDQVMSYRLIGYENRTMANQDFNNDRKDAGDLGAGHTVTALYEVVPGRSYLPQPGVDPLKYFKKVGRRAEVVTVKLRYKRPNQNRSRLITKSFNLVQMNEYQATDNFRLASSVAEFGMLLRHSPYKGYASYDSVLNRLNQIRRSDHWGHRSELLGLVDTARRLDPNQHPRPLYEDYPPYEVEPYYEEENPILFKGEQE